MLNERKGNELLSRLNFKHNSDLILVVLLANLGKEFAPVGEAYIVIDFLFQPWFLTMVEANIVH